MFIKYEAEVSSRVGGGERGVVDFGKLFAETNEQCMFEFCRTICYFIVKGRLMQTIVDPLISHRHFRLEQRHVIANCQCDKQQIKIGLL